jgi:hypothetical protein
VSDFFEPPPPPPEPPLEDFRQPPWLGPPTNALGAAVPIRLVLARTEKLAVAITDATAYPDGVLFTVVVRRRVSSLDEFDDPFQHPMGFPHHRRRGSAEVPPEVFRFGVQFVDGRKATSLGAFPLPGQEPEGPVLTQRGGGGGGGSWDFGFWLYPLPPPGPLAVVCEWPSEGVPLSRLEIDAALILEAAEHADVLWEDGGRTSGGGWVSLTEVSAQQRGQTRPQASDDSVSEE